MERKDYKRYSREFKLEAVRLASLGEKPKVRIPRDGEQCFHGIVNADSTAT